MEPCRNQVKRRRACRALLLVTAWISTAAAARAADPRVLLISIDGLRPDIALRADMPNLRSMMAHGAFTFWATTTPAAITLPSHTSMVTGVTIERHGIKGNDDDAAAKMPLLVPTIFDLAKAAGISTGMVSGKSKFTVFIKPIDHVWCPDAIKSFKRVRYGSTRPTLKGGLAPDDVTGDHAVEMIEDDHPRLMFVHFGVNDAIGHSKGWGTAAQLANLAVTDAQLGRLFDTLKSLGVYDDTTILLTADHGGSGRQHGKDDDPSKYIPWIIQGPGIARNLDLSLFRKRTIRTYDSFATMCYVLGLQPASDIDGKIVEQAFENTELLKTGDPTTEPATQPAAEPTTQAAP